MRIGFDIDGVLAAFVPAYQQLTLDITGRSLFHPDDINNPPCWDWPQHRGYTTEEMSKVWGCIKESGSFWLGLKELPGAGTLRMLLPHIENRHDIYYVTSRVGHDVKWQSELWLQTNLLAKLPTTLISSEKGMCARALSLDVYIDDNFDNVHDVAEKSPDTRTYLLNCTYNQGELPTSVLRVTTVGEMFDHELDHL